MPEAARRPLAHADMDAGSAVRQLRGDPAHQDLVRDAYLDADPREAASRYERSDEFAAVLALLGRARVRDAPILDLGAGNGIASAAFAREGARVIALDPDPGGDVGLAALRSATEGLTVFPVLGVGEAIPLADGSVEAVFARQVLHHARDLTKVVVECARVLRPGGTLLACREHVVDDEAQLQEFLAGHPVHQLAGGEHAFRKDEYLAAISSAGLHVEQVLGPLDSIVNAFPQFRTEAALHVAPREWLQARLGGVGSMVASIPGVAGLVRRRMNNEGAGRLYGFVARKSILRDRP